MNEYDLLKAFQSVDTQFLDESETLQAAVKSGGGAQMKDDPLPNRAWHWVIGIAAAAAVFSIVAVGFASIRSASDLETATQPQSAVIAETSGTASESGSADMETTAKTDAPLPSDEFVYATVPPTETKTVEIDHSKGIGYSYMIRCRLSAEGAKKNGTLVEVPAEDEPICLQISTAFEADMTESRDAKVRVTLVQDGAVLPYALEKDGETALWQDIPVTSDYWNSSSIDIWVKPNRYQENSVLTAVACFDPELEYLGQSSMLYNIGTSTVTLHIAETTPYDVAEMPYTAAGDVDFIPCPEWLQKGSLHRTHDGIAVGRKMDYEDSSQPNRYLINSVTDNVIPQLPRGEIFLKMHENADSLDEKLYWSQGMYFIILCDGKPIPAFNGKYTLLLNTLDESKTLNFRLTLDENIADGVHQLAAVCIGCGDPDGTDYIHPNFAPHTDMIDIQ